MANQTEETNQEVDQEKVNKEAFPSCSECAWKNENLSGIIPCEYCIRNPKVVSKRWKGPKELKIRGIILKVPRDMYISAEMLEFFKIIIETFSRETELLRTLLERGQRDGIPPERTPYPTPWEHPYWQIKYTNKISQTTWLSCTDTTKKKRNILESN
jgi:hypothetical protein